MDSPLILQVYDSLPSSMACDPETLLVSKQPHSTRYTIERQVHDD